MKTALVMMLSMAGLAFCADPKSQTNINTESPATGPQSGELRRLDSVNWDLRTHTLSWVVQKGTEHNGEFVPSGSQHYEITPDNATMSVAEDKRDIQHDEATLLHRLLDTLSVYCAQSVVWWDNREENVIPDSPEETRSLKPDSPANKGNEPKEKPAATKPVKALPLGIAEVAAHPKVH